MTNFEKLKQSMTIDDIAKMKAYMPQDCPTDDDDSFCFETNRCFDCWKHWLESEVEE